MAAKAVSAGHGDLAFEYHEQTGAGCAGFEQQLAILVGTVFAKGKHALDLLI
jgi:hypothetical protein